ncbi:MAG: alpha/beta fold hydrolase [Betaproteobacteria bacterium]|jgi:pimeloyl-ACP methyl ester carboxylesterase
MNDSAPARRHRLPLAAGPLVVTELGPPAAVPLVFLHGVLANSTLWTGVADRLAPDHRCLLLDLPLGAHPEPMNADADLSPSGLVAVVIDALDRLGIERAILVGNDSGGALCQLMIAAHPHRLRALVLTSSDAYDTWLPFMFKPLELMAFVPGLLRIVAQLLQWPPLRRSPLGFGWLSKRMTDADSAAFVTPLARAPWARRDVGKFLRGISPRLTRRAAQHFAGFAAPVLVLWSRDDRLLPLRLGQRLASDLPRARLELVTDAYTFSPVDAPEAVAQAIDRFVRELP